MTLVNVTLHRLSEDIFAEEHDGIECLVLTAGRDVPRTG